MKDSLRAIWRWSRWPVYLLLILFVVFIVWRSTVLFDMGKTNEAVAAIHAQHITLADVTGDTMVKTGVDQATYDATVAGVDSNNNGIRDDVEIAIFKKYPNSEKIRAAEMQYAMTEQMYLTRVYNTETWKAVTEEVGRAQSCILEVNANRKEVEALVFNTQLRKDAQNGAFEYTTGHGDAPGDSCDVNLNTLQ